MSETDDRRPVTCTKRSTFESHAKNKLARMTKRYPRAADVRDGVVQGSDDDDGVWDGFDEGGRSGNMTDASSSGMPGRPTEV